MAPIGGPTGGGQAGFGSGGSFTGPAEALELVGDHGYAYSGNVGTTSSNTTMLKFTTGNYYFVGGLEMHGDFATIAANTTNIRILMNGSEIVATTNTTQQDSTLFDFPIQIIIPSYTEVEVTFAQAQGTTIDMQATLVGRIYRA